MNPDKVKAIEEWPQPTTLKELQAFLGLANYYRKFIKDFSLKAIPLTNMTKKDQPFEWGKEQEEAFTELKIAMISKPVLAMFDPKKPITIETDASNFAIGGVLSQPGEDGKLRPVAFFSTNSTDQCYDIPLTTKKCTQSWKHLKNGDTIVTEVNTRSQSTLIIRTSHISPPRENSLADKSDTSNFYHNSVISSFTAKARKTEEPTH